MGSVLAIVSKAMFEREMKRVLRSSALPQSHASGASGPPSKRASSTEAPLVLDIDRYISRGPGLAPLRDGGSLVLVTVRPPDERVLLVAILDDPKFGDDGYVARHTNKTPLTNVTDLVRELLEKKSITPNAGRLAMSLQTPRQLSEWWVTRFKAAPVVKESQPPATKTKANANAKKKRAPCDPSLLPTILRSPPWLAQGQRSKAKKKAKKAKKKKTLCLDVGRERTRIEFEGHSHEMALGVARGRKCVHWRGATRSDVDAAIAKPGKLTGLSRICLGVLSTLEEEDATHIARRVPLRSFCHQTSLLLPALARLGDVTARLIAEAAMQKATRSVVFAGALPHIGSPLMVPAVLDAFVRVPTLRMSARRWLLRYADVALVALVPLAAGISAEEIGLADLCPQNADPLKRAAIRALASIASDASQMSTRDEITRLARSMDLEEEVEDAIQTHPLAGRRATNTAREVFRKTFSRLDRPSIDGAVISPEAFEVMLEILALTDWAVPSDDVRALDDPHAFDRDSLVLCLESLLTKWMSTRARRSERWILDAACQMADGALQSRAVDLIRSWRSSYGLSSTHAIDAIGRAAIAQSGRPAGDRALEHLGALALRSGSADREAATRDALETVAQSSYGGDVAFGGGDRLVPRVGLDDQGRMHFEASGKKLVARLDAMLAPYLVDATTHERVPDFPRGHRRTMRAMQNSDEREAERWAMLKKECRVLADALAVRAERWMRDRQRWSVEEFRAHIMGHPVLRHLALGLVWGAYRGPMLEETFRVCDDLTLADRDDNSYEIPGPSSSTATDITIGVVHPAELGDDRLAVWADRLFDYQIVPLFAQLAWPILRLTDDERASTNIASRWASSGVAFQGNDLARLWAKRWREGPPMPSDVPAPNLAQILRRKPLPPGSIPMIAYEKRVESQRDGAPLRVVMALIDAPNFTRAIHSLRVQRFSELGYAGWLPWSEVDAVSVSETLLEIDKLVR